MDHIFRYIIPPAKLDTSETGLTKFFREEKQKQKQKQPPQSSAASKGPAEAPKIPDALIKPVNPDPAWLDGNAQAKLREPYRSVTVLPVNDHSWNEHRPWFQQLIKDEEEKRKHGPVKTVVEVGCWMGRNTAAWANLVKGNVGGHVFAVDHWKGSAEHQPGAFAHHVHLPHMYQQFLSNMVQWKLTDLVTPVTMTSIEAASFLDIVPDVVFIDGSHDEKSVTEDLEVWWPKLAPNGILCGDLWRWKEVRTAIQKFIEPRGLNVELHGDQNWRLVDQQYQLLPMPARGQPRPAKRPFAVFTMVREENFYLKVWYEYYSKHFPDQDIFVINHVVDGFKDTCMVDCLPATVNQAEYKHDKWCSLRWNLEVGRHYRRLLEHYECVFFTDVDEILVPNLEVYPNGGLAEYLTKFNESPEVNRRCTGYDLVQKRGGGGGGGGDQGESEFDYNLPILEQRRQWQKVKLYNKPMLTKKPFRFQIGFHDIMPDKMGRQLPSRVDPDLILLHLHRFDWTFYEKRHKDRRDRFKFSENELKNNFSFHYRAEDDKLAQQFDEECGPNEPIPDWLTNSQIV